MAVTPEAIALILLLRTIWLITMPKHLFVPYDKRAGNLDGAEMTGKAQAGDGGKVTV
jgi:hypothetical protein